MPQLVLLFKGLFSAFPTLWPLPQQGVVGGWGYVETSGAYAGSRQRSKWSSVSCLCRWPRLVFLTPPDPASGASPLCPTQLITAAHLCHPCLVVGLHCGAGGTGKDSQHTSVGELWWSGCCQRSGPSLVHCLICANPACLHPLMFFFSQVTSVSMGTYSSWSWLSHIQFCSVIWHSSAQTRLDCSLDLGHGKPSIQSSRSLSALPEGKPASLCSSSVVDSRFPSVSLLIPEVFQAAKWACLPCIGPQAWGAQAMVLITHSPRQVSAHAFSLFFWVPS